MKKQQLRACMEAAVELALIRSDLRDCEGDELSSVDIKGIAIDAAGAALGENTCSWEPVAEVKIALRRKP